MSERKKAVVFYHSPCSDGFAAAWCFWKKYGADADYIPLNHTQLSAFVNSEHEWHYSRLSDKYQNIVFADIAPHGKDIIEIFYGASVGVTVLDHHKTIIDSYADKGLNNRPTVVLDSTHSGAWLAWNYCFPDQPVPLLIQVVQDRDLWTWKIPDSAAYLAMLELSDFDFEKWDHFAYDIESEYAGSILAAGKAIVLYEQHKQNIMLINQHTLKVGGYELPALTTAMYGSSLGNLMARTAPAAVTYYREPTGWYISLRSDANNPEALDVSEIAKSYGGGGHKHAAGFRIEHLEDL